MELGGAIVSSVALSTDTGGALNEKVSFSYNTITWTAGKVSQGWDVVTNKSL